MSQRAKNQRKKGKSTYKYGNMHDYKNEETKIV